MSKRILIVEDETDISDAIAASIRQGGFEALTAGNGQEGLTIALQEHPDLILLDLKMPVMDGHEMLKRLREDAWGKKVRVIVLTSMDDVNNVATAHEGNIYDYVIKAHMSLNEVMKQVRLALAE